MYHDRNSKNRLYRIWSEARRRARNPRQESYKNKSIIFCKEWDDYELFRAWALVNGYSQELTLDRKDNDLGYNPENCKWSTRTEQQLNMGKRVGTKTKYIGVSPYTKLGRSKPFRARIYIKGKEIRLGDFETALLAAKARDAYVIKNNINCVLNFK